MAAGRLLSLDAFRGVAIALMVLAGNPGNDSAYAPLRHHAWNGWTLTDLIFPSFLFAMGASLALAMGRRLHRGASRGELLRGARSRALLLALLGLLGAFLQEPDVSIMRYPGVLQRIGLCYAAAAAAFLALKLRRLAGLAAVLLGGYAWLLGRGELTPQASLPALVDRTLLPGRLLYGGHDPDGILSTLPALATTLLGALAGVWTRSPRSHAARSGGLAVGGFLLASAGQLWALGLPMNKNLWTPSFALWSGGLALLAFAGLYWLAEARGLRRSLRPLEVYGRNPLAGYVLSNVLFELSNLLASPEAGESLRLYACGRLFGWAPAEAASLLYALAATAVCGLVLALPYRSGLSLRIGLAGPAARTAGAPKSRRPRSRAGTGDRSSPGAAGGQIPFKLKAAQ